MTAVHIQNPRVVVFDKICNNTVINEVMYCSVVEMTWPTNFLEMQENRLVGYRLRHYDRVLPVKGGAWWRLGARG